jgi:glycogen(starch) synthase
MGVPSVTSNLSGFGCFIREQIPDHDNYGIYIVDRKDKSCNDSVQELTDVLFQYWSVAFFCYIREKADF